MGKIILIVDEAVSYENLNKNRLELVKFLRQKGLPITMSWCEDSRQSELCHNDKVDPIDMTTPVVSGATSATPDVSGA